MDAGIAVDARRTAAGIPVDAGIAVDARRTAAGIAVGARRMAAGLVGVRSHT